MVLATPSGVIRRSALVLLLAFAAAFGGALAAARPVVACSCAVGQTLKEFATADNAIFTGTAGIGEARGVPVAVDRWLWGPNGAPQIWLSASSFGNSSSCSTNAPPPGTQWLWVTWLSREDGSFGSGLCAPAFDLATPEGKAKLAEALTVFESVVPPAPSAEPTMDAPLSPAATPDPIATTRDGAAATILGGLLIGSVALFGGLILVARRSRHGDDHSRSDR
jgi:hypothetical protein